MADVRGSCRAVLEGAPPGGDAAVDGAFLPGRDADSTGRWVLRDGFPAPPAWDAPEAAGVPGVFGTAPEPSRRVARVLPSFGGDLDAAGPPGWGGLGAVGGAFPPDAPALPPFVVTLVWVEVWLVLFTVLPPAEWVDRVDWECVPVPAAPGCAAFGCFSAVPFGVVPAAPGWGAPPLGAVPAEPGRELPAPAAPGAGVLAAPEGGT